MAAIVQDFWKNAEKWSNRLLLHSSGLHPFNASFKDDKKSKGSDDFWWLTNSSEALVNCSLQIKMTS